MSKWLNCMVYKYFYLTCYLTWPTSPPYLVKIICSKLLHNLEMYYLQQTIWRLNLLAHSKLKYSVYLAELLVVMTDRLKIVKIRGRNVHRVHGHKTQALRRRRVSRVSLAPGKRWCCVLDAQGRRPVETQKTHPGTTCAYLAVASEQKGCRDTKSEQSDCSKSSVS